MNTSIKSIIPIECPHCNKSILVGLETTPPLLNGVHSEEETAKAKSDAIELISALTIPEEIKESTLEWLKQKTTMIMPADVESLVNEIQKQYDNTQESKTA